MNISEAEEILRGVTPGPWEASFIPWPEQVGCCPLVGRPRSASHNMLNVAAANTDADIRFIAWCREGVPALLARIAALHQAVQHANDHADAAIEDMKAAEARAEALMNGTGAASQMALDHIARAEAAEAKVTELEAAIDSQDVNEAGLWRFWANKASQLATKNAQLIQSGAAAETALAAMTKERDLFRDAAASAANDHIALHKMRVAAETALDAERAKVAKLVEALKRIEAGMGGWSASKLARAAITEAGHE